jgi:hypothetical protein
MAADLGATDLSVLRSVLEANHRRALTQRNAGSVAPVFVPGIVGMSLAKAVSNCPSA